MEIRNFSSLPAPANYALDKFPSALIYFHWDDVLDNQILPWIDRCGKARITPLTTPSQAHFRKDATGVWHDAGSVPNSEFITPLVLQTGKYYVLVCIGHNTASSGLNGLGGTVGDTSSTDALGATGLVTKATVAVNTVPSVGTPSFTNSQGCHLACFDFVSGNGAVPDRIARAISLDSTPPFVCHYTAIGDSIGSFALPSLTLDYALIMNALSAVDGRRVKIFSLLQFNNKPSLGELNTATRLMATTGELYNGWAA